MTLPRHPVAESVSRGLRYHVVVVCLWQESDGAQMTWRFSLESLRASDRLGFGSLEALVDHLRELMAASTQL